MELQFAANVRQSTMDYPAVLNEIKNNYPTFEPQDIFSNMITWNVWSALTVALCIGLESQCLTIMRDLDFSRYKLEDITKSYLYEIADDNGLDKKYADIVYSFCDKYAKLGLATCGNWDI